MVTHYTECVHNFLDFVSLVFVCELFKVKYFVFTSSIVIRKVKLIFGQLSNIDFGVFQVHFVTAFRESIDTCAALLFVFSISLSIISESDANRYKILDEWRWFCYNYNSTDPQNFGYTKKRSCISFFFRRAKNGIIQRCGGP